MRMPVVISSDEKIFFSVAVVVESLAVNAAPGTFYELHVFCAKDVSAESRSKLLALATRHAAKLSVEFVDMGEAFAAVNRTHAYVNHVSAWKMLIAEKLPSCDRALYLDTDILVRGDLAELFATDLGDAHFAGVPNMLNQIPLRERISAQAELPEMDWYVNAGVLVFNLAAIRRDGVAAKWQALLGRFEGSVDQHILNHVSRGRIAFLPLKYNVCLSNLELYRDGTAHVFASPGECRRAFEDPVIFHFTLRTKPWDYCDLPFAHEWFRRFAATPFYDARARKRLREYKAPEVRAAVRRRGLDRLLYKVWRHLGKRFAPAAALAAVFFVTATGCERQVATGRPYSSLPGDAVVAVAGEAFYTKAELERDVAIMERLAGRFGGAAIARGESPEKCRERIVRGFVAREVLLCEAARRRIELRPNERAEYQRQMALNLSGGRMSGFDFVLSILGPHATAFCDNLKREALAAKTEGVLRSELSAALAPTARAEAEKTRQARRAANAEIASANAALGRLATNAWRSVRAGNAFAEVGQWLTKKGKGITYGALEGENATAFAGLAPGKVSQLTETAEGLVIAQRMGSGLLQGIVFPIRPCEPELSLEETLRELTEQALDAAYARKFKELESAVRPKTFRMCNDSPND